MNGPAVSTKDVLQLAAEDGLTLPGDHAEDFGRLLGAFEQSVESILASDDYIPTVDLTAYPRTDVHVPGDTDEGGWAMRCVAKATVHKNKLLNGKAIALKDNVALAGIVCTNGTNAIPNWVPQLDATIATRIMDAGGIITGKAACENACLEGVSDSSCTGKVHNPYAHGYSCGGSSSGSGRLVASGSVDMAIGCDQGGSIRIPASMCGIVGLKPTWGLVSYTGIIGLESTIDHTGPMAKTVKDVALLLEAIAGPDKIDDRQPTFMPSTMLNQHSQLEDWLDRADKAAPLRGVRIGTLTEGFNIPNMDENVKTLCTNAASRLTELGAEVTEVTIPAHTNGSLLWACLLPDAATEQGLLSKAFGRKQLMMNDRVMTSSTSLTQEAFDALGPGARNLYLRHLYMKKKCGPVLHAKCTNLIRKLSEDYDRVLNDVDVLVMPTLPTPACQLLDKPQNYGPLARLTRNVGLVGNTSPFNSTGHPALSIPVGFVPAQNDQTVKLPAGMQIVGKKFDDLACLKVGAAWEKTFDWKDYIVPSRHY